jgi:hypothetical protein
MTRTIQITPGVEIHDVTFPQDRVTISMTCVGLNLCWPVATIRPHNPTGCALVLRSLGNLHWRHWLSRALSLPMSRDPGFGIRHRTLERLLLSAESCPARYHGTPNAIISWRQIQYSWAWVAGKNCNCALPYSVLLVCGRWPLLALCRPYINSVSIYSDLFNYKEWKQNKIMRKCSKERVVKRL